MCKVLKVSRSSFYEWLNSKPSKRAIETEMITEKIRKIYFESQQRYGSPKITAELHEGGINAQGQGLPE